MQRSVKKKKGRGVREKGLGVMRSPRWEVKRGRGERKKRKKGNGKKRPKSESSQLPQAVFV